jgi:hypothetical protein
MTTPRSRKPERPPGRRRQETSVAIASEWGRRVHAEYRSAAITQRLTLWLIQIGASPDLIEAGLRIVRDELAHARLSHKVFVAAGGRALQPLARESLDLKITAEALEIQTTRAAVAGYCLGETVAVPLFKMLRQDCTVAPARAALDRVLLDEVRHRDFGWLLLEHMLEHPSAPALRAQVESELAGMFSTLMASYGRSGGSADGAFAEAADPLERAWGLMPASWYRDVLERAFERDFRPRFGKLGFDASGAWAAASASAAKLRAATRGEPAEPA